MGASTMILCTRACKVRKQTKLRVSSGEIPRNRIGNVVNDELWRLSLDGVAQLLPEVPVRHASLIAEEMDVFERQRDLLRLQ